MSGRRSDYLRHDQIRQSPNDEHLASFVIVVVNLQRIVRIGIGRESILERRIEWIGPGCDVPGSGLDFRRYSNVDQFVVALIAAQRSGVRESLEQDIAMGWMRPIFVAS